MCSSHSNFRGAWYGNIKCNGKEMIKRSKGKDMGCSYMLFGITI